MRRTALEWASRYLAAVGLAWAAQLASIPLRLPASIPFITYAPFIVASALAGGLGPGLVTTILCVSEAMYFAIQPVHSFPVANPADWDRIGALFLTGVVASVLAERQRRSGERLVDVRRQTNSIMEGISDGFVTFDRGWRYTYVNAAAAKMAGKTSEELLGRNVWELWPRAADSAFGNACRRAAAENIPVQVEAFYPEPLQAWFEVRCYPTPQGLSVFFTDTSERKRAEERLRLLESAILQASDGIVIFRIGDGDYCDPRPIFSNPAFSQMTGFSLEDLGRGALHQMQIPCGNSHLMERPRSVCLATCPVHLEQLIQRKDGSHFWAEFHFLPLADQDGNYGNCVWTCRDITERRRAEETSRLLSSIVESSNDAIIGVNPEGIILAWNKGAEQIYGYAPEEMVGRSISLTVPAERHEEFLRIVEGLKHAEGVEHFETERMRKDGRRIQVAVTVSPIQDATGKVVAASAVARDMTERKQATKALALSEERYRSLVLVSSQIVWTTNAQGEVEEDVPMWRAFTGQTVDQVQGMRRLEALHPEDRQRVADLWSQAVKNKSFYSTEYRMRRRDGEYRYMAVHGVPVLENGGVIREWVGACADITERKQAEEEIRRLNQDLERRVAERTALWEASNQELESFAYSVSHDLRAPLRAIDGFSRILLEEHAPGLSEAAQRYLNLVQKNALQMGQLIDDLLSFSRLGRQPLKKEWIDMRALVRRLLDELVREQPGRRIEIVVDELPPCEADPALLRQVLINLFSNALKYTRSRTLAKIEVGVTVGESAAPGGGPVYHVRDNGAGFDMRYADKLFGVFQRLHRAEEYEGTGVGLALVHRVITRHGGRVWAQAAVDQGATFYFTLGAAAGSHSPGANTGGDATPREPLRARPMNA